MSHIRGKDTSIETLVRSFLFAKGLRFRKNDKRYPGHPDVVLPKYHTVVFVNGCFDAGHSDLSGLPATASLLTLPEARADSDPRASNFMQRRYARADEPFARLNAALAGQGAVLRIAENARLASPLHLVFVGAPAGNDQA